MELTASVLLAGGSMAIATIVWLVRLEGRVNAQDQSRHAQDQRLEEIKHDSQMRFDQLKADVQYIRERIDRALNGKH